MDTYGLPDFSSLSPESLDAEITGLIAESLRVNDELANQETAPTLDGFLLPFERAAATLERSVSIAFTFASSVGGEGWEGLEARITPELTRLEDATYQDARLYAKFKELGAAELPAEDAWTVREHIKRFEERGAHLGDEARARLSEINLAIAELTTRFGQLVVKGQLEGSVPLTEADVEGLSAAQKAALAADAQANPDLAQGAPYLVVLRLPTQQPIQASLANPESRARVLAASLARGDGHDAATDTRQLAITLARLRDEKAKILGYPHFAALIAAQSTAETSEAIMGLLTPMVAPTQRNVAADHAALASGDGSLAGGEAFAPADWLFRQERAAAAKHAMDPADAAPYFELGRVVEDGVFYAAGRLYGLSFVKREDLAGYTDDVIVWEVRDADGSVLGLFLGDYYARTGKRGGAWMNDIQSKSRRGFPHVIVCNNLNLTKPGEGEPTLLTWDEVRTAFHEFGHALHSLLTDVEWPSTAGTNVARDFVEYPSQVNEVWAAHPEVIGRYARHVETGEPLPDELRVALTEAEADGEGFHMSEMLQAVLLDQAWHSTSSDDLPAAAEDVEDFEQQVLERYGIASPWIAPRYRTAYFNHIFSGGYAAGYYSYLWSEALDADTCEWFATEASIDGDAGLNREAGERMRREVLSRGNSRNPIESFEALRGRPVDTTPLLKRHRLV